MTKYNDPSIFDDYLKKARFFTDKQLITVINNAKLHLFANRIKEADSDDSDDGSVYHMKPFNNNDFMKHSHKDDDRASKPVTMPRNHHHSNGTNATKQSPKSSRLSISIKKSIQQGIKHNGFHQSLKGHNLMTDTLQNTKQLKRKDMPKNSNWHTFTDKDLMKFYRNHGNHRNH